MHEDMPAWLYRIWSLLYHVSPNDSTKGLWTILMNWFGSRLKGLLFGL